MPLLNADFAVPFRKARDWIESNDDFDKESIMIRPRDNYFTGYDGYDMNGTIFDLDDL